MSDSPSIVFRVARREDVPAIVALLEDDAVAASRRQAGAVAPDYEHAFDAIDADPRNWLIVAESGGVTVGTLQITYIPSLSRQGSERAQIEAVRIRSDLRGQGIGGRMMEWAIGQAKERGCRLVQLTTDKRRTAAHRFYATLGFKSSHDGMKLVIER